MNKIYLFAIASILAVASMMVAGTFTTAAFAQGTTTPSGDAGSATMSGGASNMTGTGGNTTGASNSTAPM